MHVLLACSAVSPLPERTARVGHLYPSVDPVETFEAAESSPSPAPVRANLKLHLVRSWRTDEVFAEPAQQQQSPPVSRKMSRQARHHSSQLCQLSGGYLRWRPKYLMIPARWLGAMNHEVGPAT